MTDFTHPFTVDEILDILGVESTTKKGCIFTCTRCKSNEHVRFDMKQDRSGDEGPTAYIQCKKCGKQWKQRT